MTFFLLGSNYRMGMMMAVLASGTMKNVGLIHVCVPAWSYHISVNDN